MKIKFYAVKDLASNLFANPMPVASHGVAIRSFADEINRAAQDNQLHQHPKDFELWHIGVYNAETGKFEEDPSLPSRVARGADMATKED